MDSADQQDVDALHIRAWQRFDACLRSRSRLVTTEFVLIEAADALSDARAMAFLRIGDTLASDRRFEQADFAALL